MTAGVSWDLDNFGLVTGRLFRAVVKASERSFEFWENEEDAVYDAL